MDWKNSFDPRILQAGYTLYRYGRLRSLTRSEYGFTGYFDDGAQASVMIDAMGNVQGISCSEHHGLCPHEAALLFALENTDNWNDLPVQNGNETPASQPDPAAGLSAREPLQDQKQDDQILEAEGQTKTYVLNQPEPASDQNLQKQSQASKPAADFPAPEKAESAETEKPGQEEKPAEAGPFSLEKNGSSSTAAFDPQPAVQDNPSKTDKPQVSEQIGSLKDTEQNSDFTAPSSAQSGGADRKETAETKPESNQNRLFIPRSARQILSMQIASANPQSLQDLLELLLEMHPELAGTCHLFLTGLEPEQLAEEVCRQTDGIVYGNRTAEQKTEQLTSLINREIAWLISRSAYDDAWIALRYVMDSAAMDPLLQTEPEKSALEKALINCLASLRQADTGLKKEASAWLIERLPGLMDPQKELSESFLAGFLDSSQFDSYLTYLEQEIALPSCSLMRQQTLLKYILTILLRQDPSASKATKWIKTYAHPQCAAEIFADLLMEAGLDGQAAAVLEDFLYHNRHQNLHTSALLSRLAKASAKSGGIRQAMGALKELIESGEADQSALQLLLDTASQEDIDALMPLMEVHLKPAVKKELYAHLGLLDQLMDLIASDLYERDLHQYGPLLENQFSARLGQCWAALADLQLQAASSKGQFVHAVNLLEHAFGYEHGLDLVSRQLEKWKAQYASHRSLMHLLAELETSLQSQSSSN